MKALTAKIGGNGVSDDLRALRDQIGLVGESPEIWQIIETVQQVAPTNIPVLVLGESGTGKELVAQAIHRLSPRVDKPFVVVNAGAIPEGIIESELFGHEKGAFTGAIGTRKGYFEQADGGTLFLDEVGDMPLPAQVKFLRLLEGKDFIRVGGSSNRNVDVRVVAATNKDLREAVEQGRFREDLYFRLNAIRIRIPPLRERLEDIPLLVKKFVTDFCRENKVEFEGISEGALRLMQDYYWPGNVRELRNFVEMLIVLQRGRRVDENAVRQHLPRKSEYDRRLPVPLNRRSEEVEREFIYRALVDLKNEIAQLRELIIGRYVSPMRRLKPGSYVEPDDVQEVSADEVGSEEEELESLEGMQKRLIYEALQRTNGNRRKAAQILKISERTLYRKIKEYDLPF
ncbi:MAG: sigma-54 dependent transcriptional regulator [candidate division KSB1 bacterium]|nr:sigma-54 dependent transcriptional regulator [candidate division KSB1 bacterium]MDZ7273491.1 sigma-54 dependent transcriptional regulator [candidate division KSB1 bacterium]MDZ7286917.1 sigma-54 dependent transcriptional regulator [candidate division KSB1 bacterium]MDZ7299730.1 sigma-54 dependent transcriptional regulator [candidate division KSB1 bacterium]MDZ7305669.1 sigma-54 dependent transcriptional regulator [candidate division KSB1 bacterium]